MSNVIRSFLFYFYGGDFASDVNSLGTSRTEAHDRGWCSPADCFRERNFVADGNALFLNGFVS